mgnify:CR=1 FL=1
MFETGEYVVYGRTGICQVTGVTTMRVDGSSGEKLYYVLRPGGETDGKIFTPVEGGKQVLRGIITREEAERLIDEIPSIETLSIENEKFREDSYKKCIRTCECEIFFGSSRRSTSENRPDYLMAKNNRYRRAVSEACRGSSLF